MIAIIASISLQFYCETTPKMKKSKSCQKRASSAGSSSQKRYRILSGKPVSGSNQRRIETQSYVTSFDTVKPIHSRLLTSNLEHHNFAQTSSKGPEQLLEENLHLKVELNDLNMRLNLTRTKMQSNKKKHLLYSRKLNRQFEKQLYWPVEKGHDYLITGIKHQYEKVKETLQQKCTELEMVRKTVSYSSLGELAVYCESLEVQNKILIENIAYLKKKKHRVPSVDQTASQFAPADLDYLINEERKKDQRSQAKIKALQQQIGRLVLLQKEHLKKIHFLEKLIIEKQNESYHMSKKLKAVQRQKGKLVNELKTFEVRLLENTDRHDQAFIYLKQEAERQATVQKAIFERALKEKVQIIEKMEKQIAYLSTLLSYWRPLDELDRAEENNSSLKSLTPNLNQSISLHGTGNRDFSRSKTPLNLHIDEQNSEGDQERLLIRASHKEEPFSRRQQSLRTIQREESDRLSNGETVAGREPRRSTKKWSQDAIKSRRVEHAQIEYLGELIRFKLIAAKMPLQQVRECFSYSLGKGGGTKIQQELITMREVRETLTRAPFSLSEFETGLLSRYIIEDPAAEYVYIHEGNQLERAIVKSIVRNVVGEYELPDVRRSEEKWDQIKKIYSHNMQLALKSICPKGTVAKNKFLELMNSLGIEADQETRDYLIAQMVQHSTSLTALPYDQLFEPPKLSTETLENYSAILQDAKNSFA